MLPLNITPIQKKRWLAFIRPDRRGTYIYKNEYSYYIDYQTSLFALTTKKAGWDCMRHYEILANGCIPLFKDLDQCPPNTMTHFPKQLVKEALDDLLTPELQQEMINNNRFEQSQPLPPPPFTLEKYNHHVKKLLEYTRNHLTTTEMAKYILQTTTIHPPLPNRILFLSGEDAEAISPDYMRCLLLHGFKELYKTNCHEYPLLVHMYDDYDDSASYGKGYGRGMTYSKNLNKTIHRAPIQDTPETIQKQIENQEYDLIIYGSLMRGLPFLDLVKKHYDPKKVIMICGEDRKGKRKWRNYLSTCKTLAKYGFHVFAREL